MKSSRGKEALKVSLQIAQLISYLVAIFFRIRHG